MRSQIEGRGQRHSHARFARRVAVARFVALGRAGCVLRGLEIADVAAARRDVVADVGGGGSCTRGRGFGCGVGWWRVCDDRPVSLVGLRGDGRAGRGSNTTATGARWRGRGRGRAPSTTGHRRRTGITGRVPVAGEVTAAMLRPRGHGHGGAQASAKHNGVPPPRWHSNLAWSGPGRTVCRRRQGSGTACPRRARAPSSPWVSGPSGARRRSSCCLPSSTSAAARTSTVSTSTAAVRV